MDIFLQQGREKGDKVYIFHGKNRRFVAFGIRAIPVAIVGKITMGCAKISSFMKFIQTGLLGEISLGLKRDTVEGLLGEPQDISVSSTPYILNYGSLQLSFSSNDPHATLQSIHLYFDEIVEFPHGLQLEGWLPNKSVSAEEFLIHAEHFNVVLEKDEQHTFKNPQIGFKSKADVIVVFTIEEESVKLYSIHLSKRLR